MNIGKIKLTTINKNEALRYMGYRSAPDEIFSHLLNQCETELLNRMDGKYIYRVFPLKDGQIPGSSFHLEGNSIAAHLRGCTQVILLCATLSEGVDRLIRQKQLTGMTEAMMIDSLASAAIEQVCDMAEHEILRAFPDLQNTWRFGLGYGDFPLSGQGTFLNILDAPKRIGVCVSPGLMLTPSKSVTCVIGLGTHIGSSERKTCALCSLRDNCSFRKSGDS